MNSDLVKLELKSWNRFRSPRLIVEADVLGATHSFDFAGRPCSITLPPASEVNKDDSDRLPLRSYRADGETKIPLSYSIQEIDISVKAPTHVRLPKDVLAQHPNAYDLLSEHDQSALNKIVEECHDVSLQSYDYWLRTMRWKTQQPLLGRDLVDSPETGWSTYLLDCDTNHKVWVGTQTISIYGGTAITRAVWDAIQQCLTSLHPRPIAIDLYSDAVFHMMNGDIESAVADAAVAAESFIRTQVQSSLPATTGIELCKFLDEANIRPVMTKLFPEAMASLGYGKIKISSELHELFDARNKILHVGTLPSLSREKCSKYLAVVQALIAPFYSDSTA